MLDAETKASISYLENKQQEIVYCRTSARTINLTPYYSVNYSVNSVKSVNTVNLVNSVNSVNSVKSVNLV